LGTAPALRRHAMIRRKVSRSLALSWPERRVVAGAALLLPAIWIALRMVGFARVHAWAAGSPDALGVRTSSHEPATIGTLVDMAGRVVPFSSTCLTRSLALVWLLRRRGVHGELRLGVRTTADGFGSHAWVEHEGRPVNDTPIVSESFTVLEGIGPTRPGTRL
jgi:hypothetical protein